MHRKGLAPDHITYNTMIHGYCKASNVNEAFELLDEMMRNGLMPNIVTYNTLIAGYCGLGSMDKADTEMIQKQLIPNVVTFFALINGLRKNGKMLEAKDLFQKMLEKGLFPCLFSSNLPFHLFEELSLSNNILLCFPFIDFS